MTSKKFGKVKLGRFDTPFKESRYDLSLLEVSTRNFTSTNNTHRHSGMGPSNNAARFHARRTNAVQYESPDLGPLDFKLQWSTNENKTDTRDPTVFSTGAKLD